jgi:hypothetical protein
MEFTWITIIASLCMGIGAAHKYWSPSMLTVLGATSAYSAEGGQ